MDRNSCNILVRKRSQGVELIPIDHGLSLPDSLGIAEYDVMWMNWRQLEETPTQELIDYVNKIDIQKDIDILRDQLGIMEQNITNFKIVNSVLKKCISKGLSILQTGKIIYRPGYGEEKSILEEIVEKAKAIYEDVHNPREYRKDTADLLELDSFDSELSTDDSEVSVDDMFLWESDSDFDERFYMYLDILLEQEI